MFRLHELFVPVKTKIQKLWQAVRFFNFRQILSVRFLSILIIVLALPITVLAVKTQQTFKENATPSKVAAIDAQTGAILSDASAYLQNKTQATQQHLYADAAFRKQQLMQLIYSDPKTFYAAVTTGNAKKLQALRSSLPTQEQDVIESSINDSGVYKVFHADNFKADTDSESYYVVTKANNYQLQFADFTPSLTTDSTVRFSGIGFDTTLVLNSQKDSEFHANTRAAMPCTKCTDKVAVVMFNFTNDTSQLQTAQEISNNVFSTGVDEHTFSLKTYLEEASYHQYDIQGDLSDVYGWYTLNTDNSNYCTNFETWGQKADEKVKADMLLRGKLHNSSDSIDRYYNKIIYIFPDGSTCKGSEPWGGVVEYYGGNRMWINGGLLLGFIDYYDIPSGWIRVIMHEFGHTLGLAHAHADDCSLNGVKTSIADSKHCKSIEYGDPYDVMGDVYGADTNQGGSLYYNIIHKAELGWVNSKNVLKVTKDGVYALSPEDIDLSKNPNAIVALEIPRVTKESDYLTPQYWYVMFLDNNDDPHPYTSSQNPRSILVYLSSFPFSHGRFPQYVGNDTYLINTNPLGKNGMFNSPLNLNETFYDSYDIPPVNITFDGFVEPLSLTKTGANVEIKFGKKVDGPSCTGAGGWCSNSDGNCSRGFVYTYGQKFSDCTVSGSVCCMGFNPNTTTNACLKAGGQCVSAPQVGLNKNKIPQCSTDINGKLTQEVGFLDSACESDYSVCCVPTYLALKLSPTQTPHYTCLNNSGGKCVDENYYVKYQCGNGYKDGSGTCGQDASGANRVCCIPKTQPVPTQAQAPISCPSYDTRNPDGTCHDPCTDATCGVGAYCYNAGQSYITSNHIQGCAGFVGQDGYLYSCVKGQDGKLYTDPNPQVSGRCQNNSCTVNPVGSDSCTTGFVTTSSGGSTIKHQ